jgi:hypothetical protein
MRCRLSPCRPLGRRSLRSNACPLPLPKKHPGRHRDGRDHLPRPAAPRGAARHQGQGARARGARAQVQVGRASAWGRASAPAPASLWEPCEPGPAPCDDLCTPSITPTPPHPTPFIPSPRPRTASLSDEDILWALYSIADNNSYLLFNRWGEGLTRFNPMFDCVDRGCLSGDRERPLPGTRATQQRAHPHPTPPQPNQTRPLSTPTPHPPGTPSTA